MKKSLILSVLCLATAGAYAQDDDVYFVPSSKEKTESREAYEERSPSYTTTPEDDSFEASDWANGRGNGNWDVDAYNRRGKNYNNQAADTLDSASSYDAGYEDGYEDGSYTARIVRFWSPRPGVYVSSPYYMDYYDLCVTYDPWFYGYGSPWSWGWSGWYGWGCWYGWRPYYAGWGWGWGWHSPWYDPWWGGPSFAWRPSHWMPANAQRGPVGGWTARGGSRGSGPSTGIAARGRSGASGFTNGRGTSLRNAFGTSGRGTSGSRSFNNSRGTGNSRSFGNTNSNTNRNTFRGNSETSRPSRNFNNSNSGSFGTPSRSGSGFGSGGSIGGSRGGFGGSGSRGFGGGGGGRSGGGRR